ncbi:MAG: hypothetical protein E7316_08470 [Clostridiales bacterium]|nr:hypothetical protein [Clostridiales bacterium]
MPWLRLKERLRKDGWLLLALAGCILLCLMLSLLEAPSTTQTAEEARLARVLSCMAGAGEVEVAVFYQEESAIPCGAVIVAQGADDVGVRLQITRAVCTLLGLETSQVNVFKSGGIDP